jgi:hypothetical protein
MGLASSQARWLLLVARKSDLEYRGQMINQRRLKLASDTEEIAKDYSNALSNRVILLKNADGETIDLTSANIETTGYFLYDSDDDLVNSTNAKDIEAGLRSGKYHLKDSDDEKVAWQTLTGVIDDRLDTSDDAAAEATYEYKSSILQAEDKKLEMELKNVDTQHSAIQTEMDAVKKVIDKNIESSFKTFNA